MPYKNDKRKDHLKKLDDVLNKNLQDYLVKKLFEEIERIDLEKEIQGKK